MRKLSILAACGLAAVVTLPTLAAPKNARKPAPAPKKTSPAPKPKAPNATPSTPAPGKLTAALLPVAVVRGSEANGPILTTALRTQLEAMKLELVDQARVEEAIQAQMIDLRLPQPLENLRKLQTTLGVSYLVYPRVLTVGAILGGDKEFQVAALVNVMNEKGGFAFTKQAGQMFIPENPRRILLDDEAAKQLSEKLFSTFVP